MTRDIAASIRSGDEIFKFKKSGYNDQFVKRYTNSFHLLSRLSKCERLLIDYLSEVMDEKNTITNNQASRDGFNDLIKQTGGDMYSDSTIQKAFSELSSLDLLYKIKGKRGIYQVSLYHFFKGSEEERKILIRQQLEEINRIKVNKHRHELLSKKKSP
jgi:hypothetical protein